MRGFKVNNSLNLKQTDKSDFTYMWRDTILNFLHAWNYKATSEEPYANTVYCKLIYWWLYTAEY